MSTNYFVCTLGEAAQDGVARPFATVNGLIELQAKDRPNAPAVGFYTHAGNSSEQGFAGHLLSFADVRSLICSTATELVGTLPEVDGQAIAILADSSPEFLFTWLACIWLGYPVLLIAPQCSASAIAHLCLSCQVSSLLVDAKHESLAKSACEAFASFESSSLTHMHLPKTKLGTISSPSQSSERSGSHSNSNDIAYFHHTSGTSSGLPKPIPQTNHGAVGVLPALDGQNEATFTTTPLYHGGPADIFRAWSSGALIWLFPSNLIPITATNVVRCLEQAKDTASKHDTRIPPIKYFTSVPYILQMMASDEAGLKCLQSMDLVGVGGAALPSEIGHQLVEQSVPLVSRFGSAECGFLLSSHREYEKDKEWQFLRLSKHSAQLDFEPGSEGLHELIVKPSWPHMAKRNREDGSYATSDLFQKHSSIPNAYKYHSRADAQLTLVTGKKFDPSPVEAAIVARSSLLCDVLVFGEGKQYPGSLLFRSKDARSKSDAEVTKEVAPIIERFNAESQSHARIPRNMLIPMNYEDTPLEKSSKGTILRSSALEKYASTIDNAYAAVQIDGSRVTDEKVPKALLELVRSIIGEDSGTDLKQESDLFSHGVDSVACVQIRHGLSSFVPQGTKLPLTVVEDSMTIAGLAELILGLRHGKSSKPQTDHRQQILQHVNQYTKLDDHRPVEVMTDGFTTIVEPPGKTVVLTGPTGSLGSHILQQLLRRSDISRVYLLVRGSTPQAAYERVIKALTLRRLDVPEDFEQKVTVLQCKLSEPDLGIPFQDYDTLQNDVDVVMHLAWPVNFLLSLQSFAPHFAAIENLLNLCLSSTKRKPPRFVFCSSVAAVSNYTALSTGLNVPENVVPDLSASGVTGYALSKLTAELILARAATQSRSLHDRITIVRVGQLSADTKSGIWNASEAYPQIVASAKITNGALPDLGAEEKLTWIPVDIAGKAFVEAALQEPVEIGNMPTEHVRHELGKPYNAIRKMELARQGSVDIDVNAVKVLHLVNPDTESTFTDFIRQLQKILPSSDSRVSSIELVSAQDWLKKLENFQAHDQDVSNKPEIQSLLRLLPFWKQAYSDRRPCSRSESKKKDGQLGLLFNVHNSMVAMPALTYWLGLSTIEGRKALRATEKANETSSIDDEISNELLKGDYVLKIWDWVKENVP